MKYSSGGNDMSTVSGNAENEVESLLLTPCWAQNAQNDYIESHKLILDSSMMDSSMATEEGDIAATKATMDALDSLLLNSQPLQSNLAELKPLPPFVGYTGHLSINGIQGHHYHAIATQRIPEENNNTSYSRPTYSGEQNIVSSSTCVNADSPTDAITGKPLFVNADDVIGVKLEAYGGPDSSANKIYESQTTVADSGVTHVKTEISEYDISSIDDIAAIIGSAIADTTVPNNNLECNEDPSASRDNWMELDAWIDGACCETQQKSLIITQDGLSEFVLSNSPSNHGSQQNNSQQGSTLQNLLTHGYMPLLQNRLQNGPPVKQEAPSSTSYGVELISTTSPPANVVSTTDNIVLNGRYLQPGHYTVMNIQEDRIRSPDLLSQNYPHTTTTTTPNTSKKSRSRAQKKQQQQASSTVFQTEQNLGLLGKEKPVHRCNICNRGFLNKSNIKVHLRTHTGEKPFRCETCAKAFRQKAHLIKHQQIHKRIGRD